VGPQAAGAIDLTRSPTENLGAVARALGRDVRDLTAVILDRDRHADLIAEVRAAGARPRLIPDGDVLGAIATAWPDRDVDTHLGTRGSTPKSMVMLSRTGTVRRIDARHRHTKLREYAAVEFG